MSTFLRRAYHRRLRPLLSRDVAYKMNEKRYGQPIVIMVTDVCHDGCFKCSSMSNKTGEGYVMKPEELNTFLSNIDGYLPDKPVRLSGGEPTTVGPELLWSYANAVKDHGRRLEILTNGYKLLDVNVDIFDRIILDEHIANRERIRYLRKYLGDLRHRNFIVYPMHYHQDLESLIGDKVTPGPNCREWTNSISLMRGVVYLCCMLPWLEKWAPSGEVTEDLIKSGYTFDNKNLIELIENWKDHIPASVYKQCLLKCWRHEGQKKARWYPTDHDT